MSKQLEDYERKDYAVLAKEFGCHLRIGKKGFKFFEKNRIEGFRLVKVIPLDGWYSHPKAVSHIMRDRGMEL
jgi:hypothetical protein